MLDGQNIYCKSGGEWIGYLRVVGNMYLYNLRGF